MLNFKEEDKVALDRISKFFDELKLDDIFVVGGCTRDLLLGIDYNDLDLTTGSGGQSFVGGLFYAVKNNIKFDISDKGYVRLFPTNSSHIDFSSGYREFEGGKILPEYGSRDFTINSIMYNVKSGKIVDPNGGVEDLNNKIIRGIYDITHSFYAQPVRMFKALELSSKTGFHLDDEIVKFFNENKEFFKYSMLNKKQYAFQSFSKSIKTNEDMFLENIKKLGLLDIIPLQGEFKDLLIRKKLLYGYLSEQET